VSAFQEPEPVRSALDPWWLAALPLGALLVWRTARALRARSDEAAWWVAAAAAFAPVSQVFPFLNPIADRYLYFILPGLIGGAIFLLVDLRGRLRARPAVVGSAAAVAAGLAVVFAFTSADRAKLWTNETLLNLDAARHFPEGGSAAFLAARRAAQQGDAAAAVAALRRAADRGVDRFTMVMNDRGLAPIRNTPEFRALIYDMAGRWIERAARREDPSVPDLRVMAHAHIVREEYAEAEALLERALRAGGPFEPAVRSDLAAVRGHIAELPAPGGEAGPEEGARHRLQQP
jgi:tetratricopeptide (TPR) repeat protein